MKWLDQTCSHHTAGGDSFDFGAEYLNLGRKRRAFRDMKQINARTEVAAVCLFCSVFSESNVCTAYKHFTLEMYRTEGKKMDDFVDGTLKRGTTDDKSFSLTLCHMSF